MPLSALVIHGDVGPVTGSIRHEGHVRVKGSVLPGFRAEASGDLHVERDVRAAEATSGGDLTVGGLAIGPETVLDAVGSVSLRQAADARVVAGLNIEIGALAERCELVAGRGIVVSGQPGLIVGGLCRPGRILIAHRLLASAGRPTIVRVGYPPFAETREDLERRIAFARGRFAASRAAPCGSAREARRQAAESAAFRSLLFMLGRRLAQVDRASGETAAPAVRVLARGPVEARIWLDGEEWKDDLISIGEADHVER